MISPPSTVIFVHSTAHWEAIQQQRAQLLGVPPAPEPVQPKRIKKPAPADEKIKRSHVGSASSRRRKRWTNNNFSEHPQAVLYAEDLRPPGYVYKHHDASILEGETIIEPIEPVILPTILSRHIRHDLKKAHISQGLVSNYETQLVQFIDVWLDNLEQLDNICLEITSHNQFERYVLHTISQYYGFSSFSKTNDQNIRTTFIFHPAYMNYLTKDDRDIDYLDAANWIMPEKSFFDYLFNK